MIPVPPGVRVSCLIDGLIASAARHSRRSIVLSSFYPGQLPKLHRDALKIAPRRYWCPGKITVWGEVSKRTS